MKKITLSVGIPAHNEEANIGQLLESILKQKQTNFNLEKIYVVCDGCTDKTAEIVTSYAKKFNFIQLLDDKQRHGKSMRLNTIYYLNTSDLLLSLDADVLLDRDKEIELMVKEIQKSNNTKVVGGRFIPIKPNTMMGKFSVVSYLSFEDAFLRLNSGNNYYSLIGAASLIRKELSKSFTYPQGVISDQNYLYAMATKNNKNGVKLAKATRILFKTVDTFKDWRVLGVRSVIMDKQNILSFMGTDILEAYSMPRTLLIKSLIKYFLKCPFYTVGSVAMNLFIRIFPYYKVMPKNGIWTLADSSKRLGNISR